MESLVQKFSVFGVDLRAMEIYFDSATNPIKDDLFYDVVIGPFSQKIVLSKNKTKKGRPAESKKPKVDTKATPLVAVNNPPPVERSLFEHRPKNAAAVELGRLGGLKGGNARADKLSPERRKEIAKIAAEKRWSKK